MIVQKEITLPPFRRGFHVITALILREVPNLPAAGIAHIFIKHTSAGLTLNENADPDVLADFESFFNQIVPENEPFVKHTIEGADDMPAHVKAALVGNSVIIPISEGRFNMGTWQGIYLCEFRNHAPARKLIVTIYH